MTYTVLDKESIIKYLNSGDRRSFFCNDFVDAQEMSGGNINQIYLTNDGTKKYILKQALPYIKYAGKSAILTSDRINYEIGSLLKFKNIMPDHVPDIYYTDKTMSLFIMEYIEGFTLREAIINQKYNAQIIAPVAKYLATIAYKTSLFYVSPQEKHNLIREFNSNIAMRDITENFVFTFPFMIHETNDYLPDIEMYARQVRDDILFKHNILKLKYVFMTRADALLHGDIHTGSIIINKTSSVYFIDSEFAFYGPISFELGILVGNLILSIIAHIGLRSEPDYIESLILSLQKLMDFFLDEFLTLWKNNNSTTFIRTEFMGKNFINFQQSFIKQILQETIGFAGCEIGRRILGILGVADIRGIKDLKKRLKVEKNALSIARYRLND